MIATDLKEKVILDLHEIGAIQFGEFTLKSGILSPIYIDFRRIISYPELLKTLSECIWDLMNGLDYHLITGVPYTALPIATAISIEHSVPMVMRRKEVKDYGTKKAIEGVFEQGQKCLIIEDLITSGSSVVETAEKIEEVGMAVTDVIVLLDREQGGQQLLANKGYSVRALTNMTDLLATLEENGKITTSQADQVRTFIASNTFKG